MSSSDGPSIWDEVKILRKQVHELDGYVQGAAFLRDTVERMEVEVKEMREGSIRLEGKVDSIIRDQKIERERGKSRLAILIAIISGVSAFGSTVLGKLI